LAGSTKDPCPVEEEADEVVEADEVAEAVKTVVTNPE